MDYPTKTDYVSDLDVNADRFDQLPDEDELAEVVQNMRDRGFLVEVVESREAALARIKDVIPEGVSVMNGHSTTLEEIGLIDYLNNGNDDWENLHEQVFSIDDPEEQHDARRNALTADYFLGSVNAIAQTGELVAADASGSRVGAYPYAAGNVVLVAGTNKIMDSLDAALQRVEQFAYPLEDARAQDAYGNGSAIGKELIFHQERFEDRTRVILVKERLGF